MFNQLGTMMSLLGNKGKLQDEMQKFQERLGGITVEGLAGGGFVTAKVNGRLELIDLRISDDAMKLNDKGMLEDLTLTAVQQAMSKARERVAAETQTLAANMGIPAGMLGGLPGLG